MENLLALKVFLEVADAGSFTVVGRQHGLSSSAIGKTVRRLEDRLGVCLFHRNTRSVALTQEGRLFVESCRRILREIDAIKHELTQTKGKPKGRLRVGIPLVGMVVLPSPESLPEHISRC
jgi:DNA-binding transcriptional LysR family regulator